MEQNVKEIAGQLLALPAAQRALLAEKLLRSLEAGEPEPAKDVKAAWAAEAERRLEEVRGGKVRCVDGDEVLRAVRNRNRRR